jgi:hypothetical protein
MAFEQSFYADWYVIAIAAAAISVMGASILIMLSRLFNLRNLEQVAKAEFIFAASTVLIVMMVEGIIFVGEPLLADGTNSLARCMYLSSFQCDCITADGAAVGATFTNTNTLIDWVKLYLATPANCVQDFMSVLYTLSIPIEGFASVYMEIFMSEHASGFGVKWIAERITNAAQSLSFYMYAYYLIVHMLNFIKAYAGFFFSVGVALRAFPPTRGAGAYMMALSFGLYFIFPLAYITIATMSLEHAQAEMIVPGEYDPGGDIVRSCEPDPDGSFNYICALPQVKLPEHYACGGATVGRMMEMGEQIQANSAELKDMLVFRINDFSRHLVSAICIFPLVAFVILLTFVLNTTNLFGGNIPEIGRGLVKLI